jgi:hypothetical protein
MQNRKRIAQILVSLGGLILFAGCALRGIFGYRGIFDALRGTTAPQDVIRGLKAVWFIIAWHWAVLGVVALLAAFLRTAPRRIILLLCGIVALADAAGMYAALGVFIGNEMIFGSAVAFFTGAVLFPAAQG